MATDKTGRLLCDRCGRRTGGSDSMHVMNAPDGMGKSWCNRCIQKVEAGASAMIHGRSLDVHGEVIGRPGGKDQMSGWQAALGLIGLAIAFMGFAFLCKWLGDWFDQLSAGVKWGIGLSLLAVIAAVIAVAVWWKPKANRE